jgi:hypothetical protein
MEVRNDITEKTRVQKTSAENNTKKQVQKINAENKCRK